MKYIVALVFGILLGTLPARGLEITELKKPGMNTVILKFMFRNGSVCDPKGKEGLTALTTNLITEGGTAKMTKSQIDDTIYPWSARYGSSTDKEVSIFTFEVHKDFVNEFYEIIKGLMLTPSFAEQDFQRVKSNTQNYVDQVIRSSSDEEYSKKALEDLLFRGTNYQHMVAGTSEGIRAITLDDVKAHFKKFFTKDNLNIGIAGDYSEDFLKKVKKDMEALPSAMSPLPTPGKANMPDGIQVEIISRKNALGSAIFAGYPLNITRSDDEFVALMIANSWLGEHRKSYSRLYQKIREARSMNYGDYTYIEWYERGGSNMLPPSGVPRSSNYFAVWLRPVQIAESLKQQYKELKDIKVGHAQFALRMALREIDLLTKNGMTKEDFELTKKFLRSYVKLYVETPDKELGFLMDSKFYGRKDYIKELDKLLGKATLEDVNNAIRKYLQPKNMYVTIVTDDSEAGPLAQSLKNNSPSPMSYSNVVREGLPKEILAEDEETAVYPLNVKSVTIVKDEDTFK